MAERRSDVMYGLALPTMRAFSVEKRGCSMTLSANEFVLEGLTAADDVTHPIRDAKDWSENYLSHASFPAQGMSHWLHHGRTPWDRELWQEIVVFFLPGDRYLVSKANARTTELDGPRGAGLYYRCDEPFVTWTKSFRGGARLLTGAQLRAGPLTDGQSIGVEFDLTWNALGPAFTMDTSKQTWTDAHYEQHCTVTGRLAWGDQEVELDGTGLRDHSWGPRDYGGVGRHAWIHAHWSSGRSFMIFHLLSRDGTHTLSHVTLDLGGGPQDAELVSAAPLCTKLSDGLSGYRLEMRSAAGDVVIIDADIEQAATLAMLGKSELGIGACADASHWLVEGQTRFAWDGEFAAGLTERTVMRP
jgi:hypothetical protein